MTLRAYAVDQGSVSRWHINVPGGRVAVVTRTALPGRGLTIAHTVMADLCKQVDLACLAAHFLCVGDRVRAALEMPRLSFSIAAAWEAGL